MDNQVTTINQLNHSAPAPAAEPAKAEPRGCPISFYDPSVKRVSPAFRGVLYRFRRLPPIIEHQPAGSEPGEAAKIIWRSYRRHSGKDLTLNDIFSDESFDLDENYEEEREKAFFGAAPGTPFVPRPFLAMARFAMEEHNKKMGSDVKLESVIGVNQGHVVNWNLNSFTHYLTLRGRDMGFYLAKVWSKLVPKRGLVVRSRMSRGGSMAPRVSANYALKFWGIPRKPIPWARRTSASRPKPWSRSRPS
ncbi:uncharacterized protein LOC133829644 [Humulus lupulus]|uniref:uncharacterized protein LOC133829644 n=1 Tax=Humulus lupulus TaxID=3486 RepID=UPI002B410946|nr:uncharacterized protein LOC133829644 [Humulus lupulus]